MLVCLDLVLVICQNNWQIKQPWSLAESYCYNQLITVFKLYQGISCEGNNIPIMKNEWLRFQANNILLLYIAKVCFLEILIILYLVLVSEYIELYWIESYNMYRNIVYHVQLRRIPGKQILIGTSTILKYWIKGV